MTIFGVTRNDAETRVRAMAKAGWKAAPIADIAVATDSEQSTVDLEDAARDQIAKFITRNYKGHALEGLVEAVLQAQGYTTYHSPVGADKGVDLLAAPGPLGFGSPRICVQVKSSESPIDAPTLNQLIGTMQNVHAEQGLLVSWGGFKSSIDKEIPAQFFRVRLWNQKDLIDQLLEHYDKLDADLRSELPLKRIWVVAPVDQEN
jgi:restriction system protein